MKAKHGLIIVLFTALSALRAQELQAIPSEELAKGVQVLLTANAGLGELPLKLELAADRASGFKAGDAGAIFIPDQRLKIEKADKAERKQNKNATVAVGQLWTSKIAPKDKDAVLTGDKLRFVKVPAKDRELEVVMFSLGLQPAGKKEFQLVLYGKDNQPVLRVPLTADKVKGKGAAPVTMTARKSDEDGGVLEFKLLGRFKAEIPVGKLAG